MAVIAPSGLPGTDFIFNVTIKDSNGDPQDLTAVDGYALVAYVNDKKLICKWSNNSIDGFEPIVETDAPNGEVKILLPAAKTKGLENVMVYIEPVVQVEDVDFGKLQFGSKDGEKFELIRITTPKIDLPDLNP